MATTSSVKGLMGFELDETGDLVWEYINPITSTGPLAKAATRYKTECSVSQRFQPPTRAWKDATWPGDLEQPVPLDCTVRWDSRLVNLPAMAQSRAHPHPIGGLHPVAPADQHLQRTIKPYGAARPLRPQPWTFAFGRRDCMSHFTTGVCCNTPSSPMTLKFLVNENHPIHAFLLVRCRQACAQSVTVGTILTIPTCTKGIP